MLRHWIDEQGGFCVVDDVRRRAVYGYPSSPLADTAKRNRARALNMAHSELYQDDGGHPETMRLLEQHYQRVSANKPSASEAKRHMFAGCTGECGAGCTNP